MCGISGIVLRRTGMAFPPATNHDDAVPSLRHRGPDAGGEFRDAQVWLGHRRLSILDLSSCGAQPMLSPTERFVLCYNGEVYNFREIARELRLEDLRSHSDTEVVLRAFELLGTDSLARLNGMFAFSIYDRQAGKLWLVRDRLGIKPLYYRIDDRGLAFASEVKAILANDETPPTADLSSMHEWLYYGTSLGGRTLYAGISQLPPAHYLEIDLATFATRTACYWSLQRQASRANQMAGSDAELIAETRHLLEAAVQRQLVSDVSVGVFLSGGVDSTAITAFASRHYVGKLATYSAGFDDLDGVDERPKARRIAEQYGTDHHEIHISGANVPDIVESMVRHHDAPFADAANIPLYLMAAQISAETKVVLQGDGGDELFGGYRRHSTLHHYRAMHSMARIARPFLGLMPTSQRQQRISRYVEAFAAPEFATTMALLLTIEDSRTHPGAAFGSRFREEIERTDPFARYREVQRLFADHDSGDQMPLVDLMIELPDTFLEKVDRSTMAASLEVRVPFLDNNLVDYVVRVPAARKMPSGRKKWLLKKALAGVVSDDVLYGPKTGFNVPFGYWLRTSLRGLFFDHLATFQRERPGVLDGSVLRRWYGETDSGTHDRSYMLWKMLNFMVWANQTRIRIAA